MAQPQKTSTYDLEVELPAQLFVFDQSPTTAEIGFPPPTTTSCTENESASNYHPRHDSFHILQNNNNNNNTPGSQQNDSGYVEGTPLTKTVSNREKIQDLQRMYIFPSQQKTVPSKDLIQLKRQTMRLFMLKKYGQIKFLQKLKESESLALQRKSKDLLYRLSLYVPFDQQVYRFRIVKDDQGIFNNPVYRMYTSGIKGKFVMAGQKERRKLCGACTYLISLNPNTITDREVKYLGKIKSNFQQTEWSLYNDGFNPSEVRDASQRRKQLAYYEYFPNILGMRGPRQVRVVIPSVNQQKQQCCFSPFDDINEIKIADDKKDGTTMSYEGELPSADRSRQEMYLQMGEDEVDAGWPKNMLFLQQSSQRVLCFARANDNQFLLQVTFPFSAFQAFALCLSNLQFKPFVEGIS